MRPAPPGITALVPGAAVRADGSASPALRRRAELAGRLFHQGRVQRIIASGASRSGQPSEAGVIAGILTGMEVPEDAIEIDDTARTTFENIAGARRRLAPGAGLIVVTDGYHLPRTLLIARRMGLRATGAAPALSGASPWRITRALLREIPALLWYASRRVPDEFRAEIRPNELNR